MAKEQDSYHSRLKQGSDPIYQCLKDLAPTEQHIDEAYADLTRALGSCEAVYTEIGMKAGAKILYQLLLAK